MKWICDIHGSQVIGICEFYQCFSQLLCIFWVQVEPASFLAAALLCDLYIFFIEFLACCQGYGHIPPCIHFYLKVILGIVIGCVCHFIVLSYLILYHKIGSEGQYSMSCLIKTIMPRMVSTRAARNWIRGILVWVLSLG